MCISLDILIPTYNRGSLLGECLASIFKADPPTSMQWRVTVIDNNSSDDTRSIVESYICRYSTRVRYLFEKQQGRSAALNAGIRNSDCSVIGMIDDDERIDRNWMRVIENWFRDQSLDYIGGPYVGLWLTERPNWIPSDWEGVLSEDDPEKVPREPVKFGGPKEFLRGGNAVIRRRVFERVGLYESGLGRLGEALGSCEDHDMFVKIIDAKLNGMYVPELVIYHLVPPERATRSYFRRWARDHGVSLARMQRQRPQDVSFVGRIPRHMIGSAVRGMRTVVFGSPSEKFSAELRWWSLAGFIRGAYERGGAKGASATD